jgi:hypothetical protein
MRERYLEVTFRKGQALAAYLYLPRPAGAKSARTQPVGSGLVVDFDANGTPIGIEITDPSHLVLDQINSVMQQFGLASIGPDELKPLLAA